jgi:hypothetical protein
MTRVAMMQPHLIPWLGYLELLKNSEIFIVLDDYQLVRQSWSTRNRLFLNKEVTGWISLNLDHSNSVGSTFLECQEHPNADWRNRLLQIIGQFYQRAPFGDQALELVKEWFSRDYKNIAELEITLIGLIGNYLSFPAEIIRSSDLGVPKLDRSHRLRTMLSRVGADVYISPESAKDYMTDDGGWEVIKILLQDHTPIDYPQFCSSSFVPRLGFLDALANVGWDGLSVLVDGTIEWKEFK